MNFELSDEQRLLSDAARRFVADRYDMAQRRRSMTDARGYSPEVWGTFAELGWLGVPLSEEVGGFGGGLVQSNTFNRTTGVSSYGSPGFVQIGAPRTVSGTVVFKF